LGGFGGYRGGGYLGAIMARFDRGGFQRMRLIDGDNRGGYTGGA